MESYKINVPHERIDLLRRKLAAATFPDELDESGWDMGAPLADIKRLTKVWEEWDWRAAEAKLNKLPQFHTDIDVEGFGTLDIHFVHKTSKANAIPLLFIHGWPGSFVEVEKILSLTDSTPAFHVVAPSLPNYGFSEGVQKRGFAAAQYAEVCQKLMLKLGYDQYVTQSGDWGYLIARALGFMYPESCKASHYNYVRSLPPKFSERPFAAIQHALTPYSEHERKGLERSAWFEQEGVGYSTEQSTKPQTLGYAFADSPVAQLAWIYEKLHDWTDDYPWTDDEILTWVSIYWFSRAGPAAPQRIYYEVTHTKEDGKSFPRSEAFKYNGKIKIGLCYNPKDLVVQPRAWGKTLGDVVYISENNSGGHFATHEHPEVIIHDLQTMFGKKGGAYGVVKGQTGY